MHPLIITCALTGAETSKKNQPNLPTTLNEQIEATHEAYEAGATVVHLHVRDEAGLPTQRVEAFEKVMDGIKKVCPILIQISSGGAVGTPLKERLAPLELRPHMASLNMGSLNFGDEVFENLPSDIEAFARRMNELEIVPELEVYDSAMMEFAEKLIKKKVLLPEFHFQFVLGTPYGLDARLSNIAFLHQKLPPQSTWGMTGIGRFELMAAMTSIAHGGHVRVGFEDNIYFKKGVLATSNAQLVKRVASLSELAARSVATIQEARKILGIKIQ